MFGCCSHSVSLSPSLLKLGSPVRCSRLGFTLPSIPWGDERWGRGAERWEGRMSRWLKQASGGSSVRERSGPRMCLYNPTQFSCTHTLRVKDTLKPSVPAVYLQGIFWVIYSLSSIDSVRDELSITSEKNLHWKQSKNIVHYCIITTNTWRNWQKF